MWVWTDESTIINLAHATRIYTKQATMLGDSWQVVASFPTGRVTLFESEKPAEALQWLVKLAQDINGKPRR